MSQTPNIRCLSNAIVGRRKGKNKEEIPFEEEMWPCWLDQFAVMWPRLLHWGVKPHNNTSCLGNITCLMPVFHPGPLSLVQRPLSGRPHPWFWLDSRQMPSKCKFQFCNRLIRAYRHDARGKQAGVREISIALSHTLKRGSSFAFNRHYSKPAWVGGQSNFLSHNGLLSKGTCILTLLLMTETETERVPEIMFDTMRHGGSGRGGAGLQRSRLTS